MPCVAKVARRKPSRRLSTPAKAKKPSVPVVLSAPTKKRSARAPPGRVVERLDFGAARREGSTYTETPDDGAAAPATADAQLAATLAHMATATSPPRLASAEVRRFGTAIRGTGDPHSLAPRPPPSDAAQAECVAVSYHGITGAPVYDSGLPYCSLDGLCPPEVIAEMRAKAYFAAMFSAEIAAGTLAAW